MLAFRADEILAVALHHRFRFARGTFFDDQHRRNIILNRIAAPACLTLQTAPVSLHLNLRAARGANQNFQQVLWDRHLLNLSIARRRIHADQRAYVFLMIMHRAVKINKNGDE